MPVLRYCLLLLFAFAFAAAQDATPQLPRSPAPGKLSQEQKTKLAEIKAGMEKKIAPVALRFAEVTKRVYENMLSDSPDEQLRLRLSTEMQSAVSSLLAIKGDSIWAAIGVLTPEQKASLKAEFGKPGAPADLTELMGKLFGQ